MRPSLRAVATALFFAPLLAACGEPPAPAPAAAPAWDRDVARREVLAAALVELAGEGRADGETSVVLVDDTLRPTKTYAAEEVAPAGRSADLVTLPSGRKVYRPRIETASAETFEDWIAQTAPNPAPRDLPTTLRIEWREAGGKSRARSSASACLLELSDVGFSRSHEQALLQATRNGECSSSGFWLLLQRKDDGWVVAQRARTFIACA